MLQLQPRRICRTVASASHRRQHFLRLGFESLEPRCCLAVEGAPPEVISQDQAIALALNDLNATDEGFVLENRRHTATFSSDGLRMTPADGGPQWHWQLSHVGTVTASLDGVEVGLVSPTSDDARSVTYDRNGLTEQYVLRADSVEQQFVVPEPLALNGGDLIVAGTIQSDGGFSATTTGWEWRTDDGVISLGDVTVLDANGNEVTATMDVSASSTRIVIGAEALAGAAYPLLIDPQVGTNDFRISEMGPGATDFDAGSPAVAYNSTLNQYLVVWSGDDEFNGEFEIFGQLVDASNGAEVGNNDFRLSDMGGNDDDTFGAFEPAVAYNSVSDEYLVVWSGDTVDDDFEIFGQRVDGDGAEIGNNDFFISVMGPLGNANFPALSPAVAYNSTNNEYLVVWEAEHNVAPFVDNEKEIFGQRVAADGSQPGTADFRISDMGTDSNANFDATSPDVAYNSTNQEYLVVWSGDDNTAPLVDNEFEIFGQRLNAATGAAVGTNDFRISEMGTNGLDAFDATNPAVAYNGTNNEFLVVWNSDDDTAPLGDGEQEIYGQRLNAATGTEVGTNDFRISDMGPNGSISFNAVEPDVTYNGTNNEFLVVWHGDDNVAPLVDNEFEIFGQRINAATGVEIGSNDFRLSDMGTNGSINSAAVRSAVAYNSTNNQFLAVWEGDDNPDESETFGQRLDLAGTSIGTNDFRLSNMGVEFLFAAQDAAVAYNAMANEYLVVWSGADFVLGEFEIFGRLFNAATGAAAGSEFRISDMGSTDGDANFGANQPAVAYNSTNNEYLVVWGGDDDTAPLVSGELEIFGQRLSATGAALGTNDFRISDAGTDGSTSFFVLSPAVAYSSGSNEYLVVWQAEDTGVEDEFEIFGQRLNAFNGAAVGTNDFRISDMGPEGSNDFDASDPAVAYNTTNNEYLVVWRGEDDTAPLVDNELEIFGQRINASNGVAVGTNDFRISDMGTNGLDEFDAINPAVAYNGANNEFLVVWSGDDDTAPLIDGENEIFGQRINAATGAPVGANDFRISDLGPDGDVNFQAREPAVAYNSTSQQYLVVWRGDDNTAPLVDNELEIFAQQLSGTGAAIGPNDLVVSETGPAGSTQFIVDFPAVASSTADNELLIVWEGLESGGVFGDGELEIFGQRFLIGNFGKDKIGVKRQSTFFQDVNGNGTFQSAAGTDRQFNFGNATDIGIVGDWNGDGIDDIGVQRGNQFFLDVNGNFVFNGIAEGDALFTFGNSGDKPLAGDWDGDGDDEIGVQRGNRYFLDQNGNGVFNGIAGGDLQFTFRNSGDAPLIGDWDGNGKDEIGSHSANSFFLDFNGNGVFDDVAGGDRKFVFGNSGDIPIAGDWNDDGRDKIGVRRDFTFFLDANGNGVFNGIPGGDLQSNFGATGDLPIDGKWKPLAALMAAGGASSAAKDTSPLTTEELAPLLRQAMLLWANAGLSSSQMGTMNSVQVRITNLPGAQLGLSLGGTILLDSDAAGYGWFVDPTPADNSEFDPPSVPTSAQQSMDLLTAVLHELGHELGFDHDDDVAAMLETLAVGTRRLPER